MTLDIAAMDRMIMSSVPGSISGVYRATPADSDIDTVFAVDDEEVTHDGQTIITEGGALVTALQADVGLPRSGAEFDGGGKRYRVSRRVPTTDPSLISLICTVEDLP